ncbi:unnamed protein product [Acanthosepion pharaonis]|uniref:Uncharacterized protein n=1 Tax=Acanthosepion pharaonis TaxID=158019 RepID=A0A812DAU9_ACAPH|nr:unnamed protein product [Sepia pharaonis]
MNQAPVSFVFYIILSTHISFPSVSAQHFFFPSFYCLLLYFDRFDLHFCFFLLFFSFFLFFFFLFFLLHGKISVRTASDFLKSQLLAASTADHLYRVSAAAERTQRLTLTDTCAGIRENKRGYTIYVIALSKDCTFTAVTVKDAFINAVNVSNHSTAPYREIYPHHLSLSLSLSLNPRIKRGPGAT